MLLRLGILLLVLISAMGCMTSMPGRSYSGPLQPLTPEELTIRDNLKRHVYMLAGTIGERNSLHYEALQTAALYIEGEFKSNGCNVACQEYQTEGKTFRNIEVEIPGAGSAQTFVVGAHSDSAPGTPGANDNASGVAAVLELARLLKASPPLHRKIRLVAFVNEEPPFFFSGKMGSSVYAQFLHARGERVAGMFSLETIGYYSDEKKSQHYPPVFKLFYPGTGNFIAFVGNLRSRSLVRQSVKTFRETTMFPCEGGAVPGWIPGVFWSDHLSFWREGYSALMVTDTAPFRYQYYHTPADTPEKVDYDRTARVVMGIYRVICGAAAK